MRIRLTLAGLLVVYLAVSACLGPTLIHSRAVGGGGEDKDPFEAVFEIMNRLPKDKGCYGCHVGPKPSVGFWFGEDKDWVHFTLATGINPDGEDRGFSFLQGGRDSLFGHRLRDGVMPLGGPAWEEKEIALMEKWLAIWE